MFFKASDYFPVNEMDFLQQTRDYGNNIINPKKTFKINKHRHKKVVTEEKIIKIIKKWGINKAVLARKMNIKPARIRNCFCTDTGNRFNSDEVFKLSNILIELRKDLEVF